eukprot:2729648-Prymnesium_polylepis.3
MPVQTARVRDPAPVPKGVNEPHESRVHDERLMGVAVAADRQVNSQQVAAIIKLEALKSVEDVLGCARIDKKEQEEGNRDTAVCN